MAKVIFACLVLLVVYSANGQVAKQKWKFNSVNQAALLAGGGGDAFALQTINGFTKNKWYAGAGVGLDLYADRTVPVFIDIRRDLNAKNNRPFVYADMGLNFLWLNATKKAQRLSPKTSPGAYYDIGVGLKLISKNNTAVLLSAGYTLKQVKEQLRSPEMTPDPAWQNENYDRYNYIYRRFVFKFGVVF